MADRDHAATQRGHRRALERSRVLLLVGIAILMPPFATIFAVDGFIAGLPVPLVYVFVVWILLIAGTALLARALLGGDSSGGEADSRPAGTAETMD